MGLIVHAMDVDTAFLNADIDEDIWVKIPEGTKLAANDDGIYKLKNPYTAWNKLQRIRIMTLMNTSSQTISRDWKPIRVYMLK